ncbi:hypothetical protein ANANG_G00112250 [Anguilla anguilla]|uniref:Uncharacterized protein n=1 Tax=Anguilla anguilla TaxID=7936 RepID=A0A9D3MKF4_ANGAN|nr:hypothetical protein ANANG_G00112250 [Anguilla anguilla]
MVDIPRRAGKANALAEKGSSVHLIGDQCADVEEGRTELVLIKEETLEEDPQGEMKNEEQEESYFSLDQQMADIPRRARKANALAEKGSPVHLIGDQERWSGGQAAGKNVPLRKRRIKQRITQRSSLSSTGPDALFGRSVDWSLS